MSSDDNHSIVNIVKVIYPYTEKSFVVVGDTKPLKDELVKLFNCRFNAYLQSKENAEQKVKGWVFSLKCYEDLKKFLKNKDVKVEFVELDEPYTIKKPKIQDKSEL